MCIAILKSHRIATVFIYLNVFATFIADEGPQGDKQKTLERDYNTVKIIELKHLTLKGTPVTEETDFHLLIKDTGRGKWINLLKGGVPKFWCYDQDAICLASDGKGFQSRASEDDWSIWVGSYGRRLSLQYGGPRLFRVLKVSTVN